MHVTPLPIVTLFKLSHPLNAKAPMSVTLSGIVMLVMSVIPSNTPVSILVTPFGMMMLAASPP
jgi:hypothetical protein